MFAGIVRKLDTSVGSKYSLCLRDHFSKRFVGQTEAVDMLADMMEYYQAGFLEPSKPVGTALLLGPTGSGKTVAAEVMAEYLYGSKKSLTRIDCAEFQHSHEIAKLIGSPPGYLGHRETHPALTQEAINQFHTAEMKLSIILLDEIEKASDSLWSLLLGIMDNATLTLGDNRKVDFSSSIILMTSNVGAQEMSKQDIGFSGSSEERDAEALEKAAKSAAKSKFSPEFMNRLQYIVAFQRLTEGQIKQILEIELNALSPLAAKKGFGLIVSPSAKVRLLSEGFSKEYGARFLKRAISKLIQRPLANLYNSGQITPGNTVVVDDSKDGSLDFYIH